MMKKLFTILAALSLLAIPARAQSQGVVVRANNGFATNLTAIIGGVNAFRVYSISPTNPQFSLDDTGDFSFLDANTNQILFGVPVVKQVGVGLLYEFDTLGPSNYFKGPVTVGSVTGNGAGLTALNAGNLSSGVAPVARLGTGSGSATTFLNGTGGFTTPAGSVSSVALTGDGTVFQSSVSGSPITTSGTFAPALQSQSGNVLLASPSDGTSGPWVARQIVASDLGTALGPSTAHALTTLYASTNNWGVSNSTQVVSIFGTNNGVGTQTLASGNMNAGTTLHIDAWGPSAEALGNTLNFAVLLGGTTIYTNTFTPGITTTAIFNINLDIVFRNSGASGSAIVDGGLQFFGVSLLNVKGVATTVNTTSSKKVDVIMSWQTAQSGDNLSIDVANIKYSP